MPKSSNSGCGFRIGKLHFNRDHWTQLTDTPVFKPEYPCEGECIEVAALVQEVNLLWMFYAGACNNKPQQIGMAKLIFFIRNKDNGNTLWISNVEVFSNEKEPYLKR